MGSHQVNGNVPSFAHKSAFLRHILNYPVISDGIHNIKGNEYAQRSLKLGDSAYQTFAAPVVPYLSKPYGYVSPYVEKADALGEHTLVVLDERFPVLTKPTADLYADTRGLILMPYNKGLEGKDHVFSVYSSECKKMGQQGVVGQGKAAFTTALIVSTETITWLSGFLSAKKDEASSAANEKVNNSH
jgi:hypothetical protein